MSAEFSPKGNEICSIAADEGSGHMELLTERGIHHTEREQAYEFGLPDYLQHDLDAYKADLKEHSGLLDCLWGELYGSINMAEISDGAITPEHADYLRKKFLYGANL